MHIDSTDTPPDATERSDAPLLAVVVLCLGGLAAAMTQTMVIPIQSELPRLLSTSASNAGWVVTVTLLAAAVTMPVAGRLGDLFGKQRVLVVSASILAVGSAVAATSDSLTPMLAGRVLQGMGMGFIPVGISIIRDICPPRLAGTSVAAMSATLGVGGAIGLPLSAWVVQSGDWHTLFWIATGLAVVIAVATWFAVPHTRPATSGRLDLLGAGLLAVALVSFLVGVSKANEWGWTAPKTLGAVALGLVVGLVWGAYELRHPEPLVDLRTSAKPTVLLTNFAAVAIGFGMMAQSIVVPQLLQLPEATGYGLGQSILAAGLWMAPAGLMMMVFAPVSSQLIRRAGAKTTLVLGAAVLGAGYLVALALMGAPWQLLVASCVTSAGVGIGYAAMPTLILDAVPPREAGAAVGLNALMRSLGTTLAAAVMATLLSSNTQGLGPIQVPTEGAFQLCFVIGAAAAFVGVLIALAAPRTPSPATSEREDALVTSAD